MIKGGVYPAFYFGERMLKEKQIEILTEGLRTHNDLVKNMGESCWRARSASYVITSFYMFLGLITNIHIAFLFSITITTLFFFIESGYRQIQNQHISNVRTIENCINDFLVNDPNPRIPPNGISTSVNAPTYMGTFKLLKFKRYLFWMPYLVMFLFSASLWSWVFFK